MCGIAGIVYFDRLQEAKTLVQKMTDAMAHRGPDADGFYEEPGMALGHRRLSIIDLSAAANQPFTDNSGRYKLIFNGEMYNYESVKQLLPDYDFKTTSDTEVIIAAYSKWGAECIQYFRGMFTIVIWDRQEKEIFLCRDRLGVKPLYYFLDDDQFVFASEVRAILSTGLVERTINQDALRDYFSYQSVSSPLSLIKGIRQLKAGSWMKIKGGKASISEYWNVTNNNVEFDFRNKQKVLARTRELLLQAVSRRLVSDVPVGAFLSGGIDSSVVVGLMAEAGKGRPNSFNISFDEKEYDESAYAEMIAKKFNTHHTRILLKPDIFLQEMQHALDAMDTPSGDGMNTYVVSKAIHEQGMKVALSGVGGDELFAGYPYFSQYLQMQEKRWLWALPKGLRKLAAMQAGGRKARVQQLLAAKSPGIVNAYPIFRQILSPALLNELTTLGEDSALSSLQDELNAQEATMAKLPLLSQVSAAEYIGYTQQTLLKDADQMSMAFSLELREPLFDHDLIEFVLAIPDQLKKPVYPKSLMVEAVKPLLPDEIVFRKKQGFLFPWEIWLRNDLRTFCEYHINSICKRSFIRAIPLKAYWQKFLQGDKQVRWAELWLFVVLNYWLEKNNVE